ncbi:MAG: carboxypeptidase regulatory-like domain-containing protein [Acidobacteriota bacterium]
MKAARFLIFALVVSLLPLQAFGQTATTARISGVVSDSQGAIVAGAAVKLIDKATKTERTDATNSEGRYVFPNVEPGLYEIAVTAQGFRTTIVAEVKAEIAKTANVDISLQAGGTTEQVTVTATGEVQLQKDDSAVGNVIESDRIQRLPNANRQVTSLLQLQPAISPTGETSGSRGDQNTFSLDGIDVTDNVGFRSSFATVIPTPTESVEEFRVTVANPNATFGRSGGAQVTLVTKRGTNQYHGSAYEYHQNDNLNANSWTNNRLKLPRPPLIDNRFGFSLGGAIWKEKVFFFGNYEGRRLPGTQQINRVVPTDSFRAGQLRFRDASGAVFTVNPRTFDPRALGANAKILSYLNTLPKPNNSGFGDGLNTSGFTSNVAANLRSDYGVLRLDYQINQNWSFEAKGALSRNIQINANQVDLINLKGGDQVSERPKNLTFGLTGTLRPNLVNEVRIGHSFDNFILERISPTTIAGFNVSVNLAPSAADSNPAVALLDEAIDVDTQRAREQSLSGGNWQFIDNATWSKGSHTVQFGGNLRYITTFHYRDDKVIGSVATPVASIGAAGNVQISAGERPPTCGGAVTQNCLQSSDLSRYNQFYASLLGIVDSVSYLAVRDGSLQPLPPGTGLVNDTTLRHWEFYFSDVWRIKSNFTLSYGLTYQWHTPPKDELDRQTVLAYKDSGQLIEAADYLQQKRAAAENGEIFNPDISYLPIKETGRVGVFDINRKDFSPRFALSWQPAYKSGLLGKLFGDNHTVIRGGYALLYDRVNTVSSVVVPMLGVGFAQTLNFRAPKNSAGQPFRAGIDGNIPVPVNTAAVSPVVPAKPFGELLSFTMDPVIRDPYNHSVDFSIQRELPGKMLIEVGYIGRFARNLIQNVNLNSAPYFFKDKTSGQTFAQAFDSVAGQLRNGVAPGSVTPQPWFENQLAGTPFAAIGATRFIAGQVTGDFIAGNINNLWNTFLDFIAPKSYNNQQSLDLFVRTSLGRSNYNAFFVSLHKRTSKGLTMDFNYTLSRSLDQIGGIQNFVSQFSSSFDGDIDYAPSDFDRTHIANANFVYDLPFGRGRAFSTGNWLDNIIGGWYASGIWQAASGGPLTVVQGFQVFGAGAIFGTGTGAIPLQKPDYGNSLQSGVSGADGIGTAGNPANRGTGLNLFANPENVYKNFRRINISEDGRSGRGVLRGLTRWQFDMSFGKQTRITEKVKLGLSFDFFNIFNHVNFADPSLDLNNRASFGVITSQLVGVANGFYRPRVIQIGARIDF